MPLLIILSRMNSTKRSQFMFQTHRSQNYNKDLSMAKLCPPWLTLTRAEWVPQPKRSSFKLPAHKRLTGQRPRAITPATLPKLQMKIFTRSSRKRTPSQTRLSQAKTASTGTVSSRNSTAKLLQMWKNLWPGNEPTPSLAPTSTFGKREVSRLSTSDRVLLEIAGSSDQPELWLKFQTDLRRSSLTRQESWTQLEFTVSIFTHSECQTQSL